MFGFVCFYLSFRFILVRVGYGRCRSISVGEGSVAMVGFGVWVFFCGVGLRLRFCCMWFWRR